MIKRILISLVTLVLLTVLTLGGRMFWLGKKSQTTKELGPQDGHLQACGNKPNCVTSSTETDSKFYIAPLVSENIEGLWDDLNMSLKDLNFDVVKQTDNYIHATETSQIFGFVDDIEFLLLPEQGLIEMRSESRVGYSDLGVNRKRLEKVRKLLQPQS